MNKIADINGEFRIRVGIMHPKSMIGDVEGIIKHSKEIELINFYIFPFKVVVTQFLKK